MDSLVDAIVSVLLFLPRKLFEFMTDFVLVMINLVPPFTNDPDVIRNVLNAGGGIGWLLDLVALDYGFPIMILAMVSKFILRRIPFIG